MWIGRWSISRLVNWSTSYQSPIAQLPITSCPITNYQFPMTQLLEKYPAEIEKILDKYPPDRKRSAVLPLLYIAQKEYGYCTPDAIREVAGIVGVEPTEVESVVGFYTLFYDHPVGEHVVQICNDLPCALRGSEQFLDHACQKLNLDKHKVEHSGQTTQDGSVTLDRKSTRLNSSHSQISYAVFCLKKKKNKRDKSESEHDIDNRDHA